MKVNVLFFNEMKQWYRSHVLGLPVYVLAAR
jgi:hypothetical protein